MIKSINSSEEFENSYLAPDYYGRKIKANLLSYGIGFDFCKFFSVESEAGKGTLSICNSSAVLSCGGKIDMGEILDFVSLFGCEALEFTPDSDFPGNNLWEAKKRTLFEFSENPNEAVGNLDEAPKLDEVYKIVSDGFPEIKGCYREWIADVSHRVRHGVMTAFCYEKTAAALRYWSIDGFSFYGSIAVLESARGNGFGRKMLYQIAKKEAQNGNKAYLFAKEHRKSFYLGIGFAPVGSDQILEKINRKEDYNEFIF